MSFSDVTKFTVRNSKFSASTLPLFHLKGLARIRNYALNDKSQFTAQVISGTKYKIFYVKKLLKCRKTDTFSQGTNSTQFHLTQLTLYQQKLKTVE